MEGRLRHALFTAGSERVPRCFGPVEAEGQPHLTAASETLSRAQRGHEGVRLAPPARRQQPQGPQRAHVLRAETTDSRFIIRGRDPWGLRHRTRDAGEDTGWRHGAYTATIFRLDRRGAGTSSGVFSLPMGYCGGPSRSWSSVTGRSGYGTWLRPSPPFIATSAGTPSSSHDAAYPPAERPCAHHSPPFSDNCRLAGIGAFDTF
jgi:hypothetical protein